MLVNLFAEFSREKGAPTAPDAAVATGNFAYRDPSPLARLNAATKPTRFPSLAAMMILPTRLGQANIKTMGRCKAPHAQNLRPSRAWKAHDRTISDTLYDLVHPVKQPFAQTGENWGAILVFVKIW